MSPSPSCPPNNAPDHPDTATLTEEEQTILAIMQFAANLQVRDDEDIPTPTTSTPTQPDLEAPASTGDAATETPSDSNTTLLSRLTSPICAAASGTADWLETTGSYAGAALGGFTQGAIQGSLIALATSAAAAAVSMLADKYNGVSGVEEVVQSVGGSAGKSVASFPSFFSGWK